MLRQLLLNSVIAGSLYSLIATGFALVFRVLRFFHFTHGLYFAVGAYLTYVMIHLGARTEFAIVLAAALVALCAGLIDLTVFAPLSRRRGSSLVLLIASLGVYIVGQNVISMTFGDAVLSIRPQTVHVGFEIAGARITPPQITIIVFAAITILAANLCLRLTTIGKQVRAVASDRDLALVVGIPISRARSAVVFAGAGLAAIAGALACLDRDMLPTMGMQALLTGVVAMIVGGKERIAGSIFGAFAIAMAQNLGVIWVPAAWQDALVFVILILFLLFRPQGLAGLIPQKPPSGSI